MSAVAVTQNELFFRGRRSLGELDAVYYISRIAAHASTPDQAVADVFEAALCVHGIGHLEFVPAKAAQHPLPRALRMSAHTRGEVISSAVTEIVLEGVRYGDLRVFFDLQPAPVENPLRFARFVAEQLRSLLRRFHLQAQKLQLQQKAERYRRIVARRKAIHRAIAILMNTHNMTEAAALVMLRKYARQSDHGLLQIAEAIIFGDRQRWRAEPIQFPAKRSRRGRKTSAAAAGAAR